MERERRLESAVSHPALELVYPAGATHELEARVRDPQKTAQNALAQERHVQRSDRIARASSVVTTSYGGLGILEASSGAARHARNARMSTAASSGREVL